MLETSALIFENRPERRIAKSKARQLNSEIMNFEKHQKTSSHDGFWCLWCFSKPKIEPESWMLNSEARQLSSEIMTFEKFEKHQKTSSHDGFWCFWCFRNRRLNPKAEYWKAKLDNWIPRSWNSKNIKFEKIEKHQKTSSHYGFWCFLMFFETGCWTRKLNIEKRSSTIELRDHEIRKKQLKNIP